MTDSTNPERLDKRAGYPYRNGAALMHIDAEPVLSNLPAPSRDDLAQEMDDHGNHRIVDLRDGTATMWTPYTGAVYFGGFVGITGYYGEGIYTAQEFAIRASSSWALTKAEHDAYVSHRTTQDIDMDQVMGGILDD